MERKALSETMTEIEEKQLPVPEEQFREQNFFMVMEQTNRNCHSCIYRRLWLFEVVVP